MVDHPLSKQTLIAHLKSEKVNTALIQNQNHYLYSTGKNAFIDDLLIKIYTGEFDETR